MKININNIEAVDAAIEKVAGKARLHVHSAAAVEKQSKELYTRLNRHLQKKELVGTIIKLSSRPSLPKAYGSRQVIYTVIKVEVCPSGLFVVEIRAERDWASQKGGFVYADLSPTNVETLKDALYYKEVKL
jgi:hypothetical protein